jgi:hypothetical protein
MARMADVAVFKPSQFVAALRYTRRSSPENCAFCTPVQFLASMAVSRPLASMRVCETILPSLIVETSTTLASAVGVTQTVGAAAGADPNWPAG